eukprot:2195833-Lingulodinium_polyedra.AAC.1
MPQVAWISTGKYLGFYVGPGKGDKSWGKPAAKFRARLEDWNWSEMGLHAVLAAYNIYVLPV